MLDRAVAALEADREVALAMFNKGEGGFRDRDLYRFCVRISDGKIVASPSSVLSGTDTKTLKDPTGKSFGLEMYNIEVQTLEGQITEMSAYLLPKPGSTAPAVPKVTFVTRVGDLGSGVRYYK